jgi:hypothetical protein
MTVDKCQANRLGLERQRVYLKVRGSANTLIGVRVEKLAKKQISIIYLNHNHMHIIFEKVLKGLSSSILKDSRILIYILGWGNDLSIAPMDSTNSDITIVFNMS